MGGPGPSLLITRCEIPDQSTFGTNPDQAEPARTTREAKRLVCGRWRVRKRWFRSLRREQPSMDSVSSSSFQTFAKDGALPGLFHFLVRGCGSIRPRCRSPSGEQMSYSELAAVLLKHRVGRKLPGRHVFPGSVRTSASTAHEASAKSGLWFGAKERRGAHPLVAGSGVTGDRACPFKPRAGRCRQCPPPQTTSARSTTFISKCWILAQLRQPGCSLYMDLTENPGCANLNESVAFRAKSESSTFLGPLQQLSTVLGLHFLICFCVHVGKGGTGFWGPTWLTPGKNKHVV